MANPVDAPTLALDVADLVDWLELSALFNEFGVARLDGLRGALKSLEESAEEDIGEDDRASDALIEKIENEIALRSGTLGNAYPFQLGAGAEELEINKDWREPQFSYYLICLLTTHVSGSAILRAPPTGELLTRLRNRVFQIVATLGLAGLSSGPAFSVGWPRVTGEKIVDLLERAAAAGGGFTARRPHGKYVSPAEKDGGVDVIAWTDEGTPPPTAFFFGQTASGRNWPGKPVTEHARTFGAAYMQDHMTGNLAYVTLIPYRVLDEAFWHAQHQYHMAILDRLRLPKRAMQGAELAARGVSIDDGHSVGELTGWVSDYYDYARAA